MDPHITAIGPIMQLAFVPRDFAGAVRYWTQTMGVGPFFRLEHVRYESARYRGQPATLDFSINIAYWGDIQIELIEQHDASPSIYTDWLGKGREGLHHVCIVTDDIARSRAICEGAGYRFEQEIVVGGGVEAFYVDTGGGPGTMVEVIQPNADMHALFAMMRDTARGWDGKDPVRLLG